MSELSQVIAARMDQLGLSNRDVAARTLDCPTGGISHATVGCCRRGGHGTRPTGRTLNALAHALNIPVAQLRRVAGLRELHGPWVPPAEASMLTVPERDALAVLIAVMVTNRPATSTALCDSRCVEAPEVTHVSRVLPVPDETKGSDQSAVAGCH